MEVRQLASCRMAICVIAKGDREWGQVTNKSGGSPPETPYRTEKGASDAGETQGEVAAAMDWSRSR